MNSGRNILKRYNRYFNIFREKIIFEMNLEYQDVWNKIQARKENVPNPEVHLHKVRLNFSTYSEESTPKPALSNEMYTCVGRLKFYPDKMIYMYLEVSTNPRFPKAPWPAKVTWKVELIDENDDTRKLPLGESSFIFNKPKQGFASHPNDWISVSYNQLKGSPLIGPDKSMTIKWSVISEPALEYLYLEQLEDIILQREINSDRLNLRRGLEKIEEINNLSKENTVKISKLHGCIERIQEGWEKSILDLRTELTAHSAQISSLESNVQTLKDTVLS
ncbi:hypothetical protein Btru_055954 [Bulinus truncatus]|nr:hypothetical protein Btru_055954 [Bulinus truncatus]